MKESVTYQAILEEGRAEGKEQRGHGAEDQCGNDGHHRGRSREEQRERQSVGDRGDEDPGAQDRAETAKHATDEREQETLGEKLAD